MKLISEEEEWRTKMNGGRSRGFINPYFWVRDEEDDAFIYFESNL